LFGRVETKARCPKIIAGTRKRVKVQS